MKLKRRFELHRSRRMAAAEVRYHRHGDKASVAMIKEGLNKAVSMPMPK